MVYCGKPSGSCHACRERKTRCDQILEGCTQCKRAKRECPGYRVQGDLIFRDNTSNVIKKAKAREAKAKKPQNALLPSSVDLDSLEVVQQEETPLSVYSLAPTLEDRAIGFFITNYVVGMDGPSKGHMDYLVDVARTQILDEWLDCSMKAVGLAAYAHAAHAPSLLKNARYQYVRAIQATNKALRDPVEVKKDTTLMSVMVLGIFETVTGTNRYSLRDWAHHLHGAASVIKLRGPDQIKTAPGRRMLLTIMANLLISCMQRGVPLPKHMREYMNAAFRIVPNPDPAFVVLHTMMGLCELRAEVVSHKLTDRHEIIKRALELDGILLNIASSVPSGWEFKTVTTDSDSLWVFNGHYHIYYDYWIAQIWNAVRTNRILLNEMIRDVLLEGFACKPPLFKQAEYTAQFQVSTDVLYEMQRDILYSIPQHVGFPFLTTTSKSVIQTGSPESTGTVKIPMTGAWFLFWPLWLAGLMDIATEEIRSFVILTLQSLADSTGVNQARILADILIAMDVDDLEKTVWKGFDDNRDATES